MNVSTDMRFDGFFQKGQELLTITSWFALTKDLTGTHVQRGEQIRRAMPDVVMGVFFGRIERDRQHRLGPVQAWICVFSSIDSTTAPPGGSKYSPTISATFSANAGSLLTLNVPARCGFNPFSRHSFAT
jgi:hypothetical protein